MFYCSSVLSLNENSCLLLREHEARLFVLYFIRCNLAILQNSRKSFCLSRKFSKNSGTKNRVRLGFRAKTALYLMEGF